MSGQQLLHRLPECLKIRKFPIRQRTQLVRDFIGHQVTVKQQTFSLFLALATICFLVLPGQCLTAAPQHIDYMVKLHGNAPFGCIIPHPAPLANPLPPCYNEE